MWRNAAAYDENLNDILKELSDAEDILNGVARSISDYMNEMEFDEETFKQTEERLDRIRSLMAKVWKFGGSRFKKPWKKKGNAFRSWKTMKKLASRWHPGSFEAQTRSMEQLLRDLSGGPESVRPGSWRNGSGQSSWT